ncbi:hypothetical protein CH372_18770 [Leptospira meyeri]|uniref:Kiwa anti-phage protein KwaB-like domain-containing protein n=1 Tax=Leptospira meyeri TaxID=29508 RepID=UPI000C2AED1F|nr:Kiwa anti-phage protein KwaB-like domain-containing protein [Leptospira meyeri]PKA10555.1 hypothetical protein CH372_18770 [Leptospira meyeri]
MTTNIFQFYAIVNIDSEHHFRHIVLISPLQIELSKIFQFQIEKFQDVSASYEYDGRYKTENNESLFINNFPLPQEILNLTKGQITASNLSKSELENSKIISIFGIKIENSGSFTIGFQSLTSSNLIKPNKFNLIFSQNTFVRNNDPGITINENVVAVFQDNKLYFKAFSQARRVLDLTEYLKSASDNEIEDFLRENPVVLEDKIKFNEAKDEWIRKKIFLIHNDQVLLNTDIKAYKKAAKTMKLRMKTTMVGKTEKIILPADKKNLKLTLNLLDDDILDSIVTHKRYISNSKRIYQ